MARDIFDPARYTNCSVKCTTNNTDKILNNEKGRLQKVLNKVTQFDPTSKYVAKGKQLISVSNKIYDSKIIPRKFAEGITGVVDEFGVKPFLDITDRINPEMAGQTKRQLEVVSNSLRAGNLKFKDVEKIAGQLSTLTKFAQNIFNTDPNNIPNSLKHQCLCDDVFNPAKFIADLYFPKYTSWFCVEFVFNNHVHKIDKPDDRLPLFAFLCLRTTRPNVKFEIEEVMKYGHKSFVQKRSEYESLDLTFIDDDQHNSHTNFETLLRILIPSMNLETSTTDKDNFSTMNPSSLSDLMVFSKDNPTVASTMESFLYKRASSMNELYANSEGHVLKSINVYQIFKWGKRAIKTSYLDPVISNCKWSELDTESSSSATIDASFRFSTMTFETLDITESIATLLNNISVPVENQDIIFDINNGSLYGKPTQLGPSKERVQRYKLIANADTNKSQGFLDRLKRSVKGAAKRLATQLKESILKSSFIQKAVKFTNELTDLASASVQTGAQWLGNAAAGDFYLGDYSFSISKVGEKMIDGINNVGKSALEKLPSADKILADKELTKLPIDQLQKIINEKETTTTSSSDKPPQPQQTNKKADELQFINGFNNNGETIKNSDQTKGLL